MHACERDNLKIFFCETKRKMVVQKKLKKVKVKKIEFKKIEIKKIKEEMKTRKKNLMKEKIVERDSVEAKKDQKRKLNRSTFFEKWKEKKKILPERKKYFCQNVKIIWKNIFKRG